MNHAQVCRLLDRRIEKDPELPGLVWDAVKTDAQRGYCVYCGAETCAVEPDAREYVCEACGEAGVFGAEELTFYLMVGRPRQ